MTKISVIGTGYVGLSLAILADYDNEVLFVGRSAEKIDELKKGILPIYEKGLDELFSRNLNENKINATIDYNSLKYSEIIFVCVGTPSSEDGSIDLSQIKSASESLGNLLRQSGDYKTIVVKSTVVPGTTKNVVIPILEKFSGKKAGVDFGVCMNPEFLREGKVVEDFTNPDRIIIGELDKKSGSALEEVYKKFDSKIIRTSIETAEIIKYASNTFLGLLISYSNELANICEHIGVDVDSVLGGLYHDKRLSPSVNGKRIFPDILSYLSPGPGFGGSCLPKDISAFIRFAEDIGCEPKIIKSALEVNKSRPQHTVKIVERELKELKGKTITVLGVAFKPDTDDIRESPSIEIVKLLIKKGAKVKLYDPVAMDNARKIFQNGVTYSNSLESSLKDSEGCILVTKWDEFTKITPETLKKSMENPFIVDCRRILNKKDFYGKVRYIGIGLGN